jgi:hypothetical protein
MPRTFGRCQATDLPRTGQARQHRYHRGWQLYAPASPAIGICTVQPMFVYDAISRRPISTNMLARTGSRKRSEMRAATWLPIEMPGREPSSRAPTMCQSTLPMSASGPGRPP